jgi:hypothetical protein
MKGKLEILQGCGMHSQKILPWEYYQYTQRDVEKAVGAFTRFLDAIEYRLSRRGDEYLTLEPTVVSRRRCAGYARWRIF